MIATMSPQAPIMSLPTANQSSPKRPRLSLKIQASPAPGLGKSATALKADLDTTSPTAFNTISNAYATAIENASPKTTKAPPSILSAGPSRPTSLRLVTNASTQEPILFPSQRTQTPGPFTMVYPDTPTTAYATTTPATRSMETQNFTFTPPSSAHPDSNLKTRIFSFSSTPIPGSPTSPRTPGRRRATLGAQFHSAPYTHPLSLRSILRNSPLPSRSKSLAGTPSSPSRSSQRIAERAAKRVGYNNPLTQTITTEIYTHSHIDLLLDNVSPYPRDSGDSTPGPLDLTMAYTGDETRDGGQTPGPFEEMRRRMAGLDADVEVAEEGDRTPGGGMRKRKREKSRRWVWTIGVNEDEESPVFLKPSGVTLGPASAAPHVQIPLLKAVAYKAPKSPRVVAANEKEADRFVEIEESKSLQPASSVVPLLVEPARRRRTVGVVDLQLGEPQGIPEVSMTDLCADVNAGERPERSQSV